MATGLNCITGRVAPLEAELARRIAAEQAADPLTPVAVLIGGSLQRPYLQRRVAALNGGILNVHFLMASELALRLGQRAMVAAGRTPLPALGDRVLLGRIAAEQEGYFEPVQHVSGFADALHRTIREIRQAGIGPDELRANLDGACEVPTKAEALAAIYERFLAARADFYGPDDCLLAADVDSPPWAALHVVGLTEPPPALERLLLDIAGRIGVSVYLPEYGTEADEATAAGEVELDEGLGTSFAADADVLAGGIEADLVAAGEDRVWQCLAIGSGERMGGGADAPVALLGALGALRLLEEHGDRPGGAVGAEDRRGRVAPLDAEAEPLDEVASVAGEKRLPRPLGGLPVGALGDPGPELVGREHARVAKAGGSASSSGSVSATSRAAAWRSGSASAAAQIRPTWPRSRSGTTRGSSPLGPQAVARIVPDWR